MSRSPALSGLSRALPPPGPARALSTQSLLFGVAEGTFLSANAVYFTQVTGLSAAQVGLGTSAYAFMAVVFAVPLARVSDRLGALRTWQVFSALWAVTYLGWPFARGMGGYLLVLLCGAVADAAASAARGAYVIDALGHEQRVRTQAFMRAALNVGFTVGAGVGGLALALPGLTAVRAVPLLAFVLCLCQLVMLRRLPALPAPAPAPGSGPAAAAQSTSAQSTSAQATSTQTKAAQAKAAQGSSPQGTSAAGGDTASPAAWRNPGYVVMSLCMGALSSHQTLLMTVVPLWLVTETQAPRTFLAVLFATNTVGAVLFQVAATRGTHTVPGAMRAATVATVFFVVACVLIMNTGTTLGLLTVVLVWSAHVAITGAELFEAAGEWGLSAELSDPRRRGEYLGVSHAGHEIGQIVTPALFTWLAMRWGAPGWVVIAAFAVAARLALGPAVRAAGRAAARFAPVGSEPSAASAVPTAPADAPPATVRPAPDGVPATGTP